MLGEDHESGAWAYDPDADAVVKMWCAAAMLYSADACAAALGKKPHNGDNGKALRDLRGQRLQLERLCRPLGADVEAAAEQVERAIAAKLKDRPQRKRQRTKAA